MSDSGRSMRGRAQGLKSDKLGQALHDLDPALLKWTDDFIFDEVWGREGLSFEERMLVAITALSTQGQLPQLKNYFHGAMQEGIPAEKIQEALLMLAVYTGFPTALDALTLFAQVRAAEERRSAP